MPEGVKTLAHRVGGADRDHNTEREGKGGLERTGRGSIGQPAVVAVQGEIAIFGKPQLPPMAFF